MEELRSLQVGPLRPAAGLAAVPGHARAPHICLIFGLDMRGVGQPRRFRPVLGVRLDKKIMTGRPARAYETGLRGPVIDALKSRLSLRHNMSFSNVF